MTSSRSRIIVIVILCSFISSSSSFHDHELPWDHSYDEESGYDFEAYPSYFSPIIKDDEFLNLSKVKTDIFSLKKYDHRVEGSAKFIRVDDFGAKGDGKTDDTQAFQKAWKAACSSTTEAVFVVSKNKKYLLKPIRFTGPCKSVLTMQINGTIEASGDRSDYSKDGRHWLIFDSLNNLAIGGGGIIDGNGNIWWQNSCKINKSLPCKDAPTALNFYKSQNMVVKDLKIQNAQQMHVSFEKCTNVEASNLQVTAPGKSPNTDGIHITDTKNIQICNSVVGTGDDCISIESGFEKVL